MASNSDIHDCAQRALDTYNGSYSASDVCLNATTKLYGMRDAGNKDPALAIASHYLHCRFVTAVAGMVGFGIGTLAVLSYDGIVKAVDTLVKKYSSLELVHKFGEAPTSEFSFQMTMWDAQGLMDGLMDRFSFSSTATLYAADAPCNCFVEAVLKAARGRKY